jgi:hypothetical protein
MDPNKAPMDGNTQGSMIPKTGVKLNFLSLLTFNLSGDIIIVSKN